jgi:hypothetical protein
MAYHSLGECTCIALEVATVFTPLLALAKLFGEFALGHTGYVPAPRWVVLVLGGYRIGVRIVVREKRKGRVGDVRMLADGIED